MKYVAFCDVLGFSNAVLNNFEATIAVYQTFKDKLKIFCPIQDDSLSVSVYSDSVIIVADELSSVLGSVQALHWATMMHEWLIRGGIAYGKHWQEVDGNNIYVVSDALANAVAIEKTIKVPAIAISSDITLSVERWVPRLHDIFTASLIFYDGLAIVNPFNRFWFSSAKIIASHLLDMHPNHRGKYEWFISLFDAVERNEILIPETIIVEMLELGILAYTSNSDSLS